MKNKFYKNLYQAVSFFSVIMILAFSLLLGFIESFNYEKNNGWILLIFAALLIILYFFIGFYWLFQKVEINNIGIKITLFHKILRNVAWENIEEIKYTSFMRNPAYVLKVKGEKNLNLDGRKTIRNAILHCGNENIKTRNFNLTN